MLQPLLELLERMVEVMERMPGPEESVAGGEALDSQPPGARAARICAEGPSREEAMRALESLCAWIDQNCDRPRARVPPGRAG